MSLDGVYQPAVLNVKSDKDLAKDIREIVPEGKIYSYISVEMLRFYVVNFYNNDRVALFERDMPQEGYLLVGANDFNGFKPRYENEYTFNEVYRSKNGDVIFTILFICIILLRSKPVKGLLLFL